MATAKVSVFGQSVELKTVSVAIAQNATTLAIAAVTGKRLAALCLVLHGAGTCTFKSATTAVSGAMVASLLAAPIWGPPRGEEIVPLFMTDVGAALNVTEGNTGTAKATLWYAEVD